MKYTFNKLDNSIVDKILEINNVELKDLDVSKFEIDEDLEIINIFKKKIFENKDKKFLIVGDYDCDGICATTIMKKLLDDLNIKNNYYIPSRIKEGYGLNVNIVDNARNNGFDCLLCVDNGVVALDALNKCQEYGIKVFIIDHHEYIDEPNCEYLLHPKMFDDKYLDMCASGLCALVSNSFRYHYLNDVYGGLATLADMVSVFNYNRFLIKRMFAILSGNDIKPIRMLLNNSAVSYQSLQFSVIPKINAVSRLDEYMNVNYLVKYLLSNDDNECLYYFTMIEKINKERKEYTKVMYEKAIRMLNIDDDIILLADDGFKEGLCGLLANRLLNEYGKPVIVFSIIDNEVKGSGRSLDGFNLYAYLSSFKELFIAFGGHEQAVGLSLTKDNYDRLIECVRSNKVEISETIKDVILVDSKDVNFELLNKINSLKPFGTDFKEIALALDNNYMSRFIIAKKYPKFIYNDYLSAISFNSDHINKDFMYMIGKMQKDDYSKDKLSFIIEDLI